MYDNRINDRVYLQGKGFSKQEGATKVQHALANGKKKQDEEISAVLLHAQKEGRDEDAKHQSSDIM